MAVFYNEHDPFAAAWLRELIADNLIAPGVVDERSIEDITPDDLRPFRQCHFFAGIGVWSLAARRAGWDDNAPLWTGSCPCQPFSAAGKGEGFADERHLWPAFHYLIEQCRPALVVGEQVAGKDGDAWLNLVSNDLDATGYGFGAAETCAAGFGAPHKRNRNYWVAVSLADGERPRLEGFGGDGDDGRQPGWVGAEPARSTAARGDVDRMGHTDGQGRGAITGFSDGTGAEPARRSATDGVADSAGGGRREERSDTGRFAFGDSAQGQPAGFGDGSGADKLDHAVGIGRSAGRHGDESDDRQQLGAVGRNAPSRIERPGPVNGLWADADWIFCRDEKWRPTGPGIQPLADAGTIRNRVGLLRGAGNAVTLAQAEEFLVAVRRSLA